MGSVVKPYVNPVAFPSFGTPRDDALTDGL